MDLRSYIWWRLNNYTHKCLKALCLVTGPQFGHSFDMDVFFFFSSKTFLQDEWKAGNVSSEIIRAIYISPPLQTCPFSVNLVTFEWQQTLSSSHWFLRSPVCPLPTLLVICVSVEAAGPQLPVVTSFCILPSRLGSYFRKALNIPFIKKIRFIYF